MEFAYFYNALGTKVTVVEMMPHVLPVEDQEIIEVDGIELQETRDRDPDRIEGGTRGDFGK
jgi:dihydrolipoamide dehydrogenase